MKNYIPQSKDDMAAVDILFTMPFEEIRQDSLELLTWLQDLHWEVAHGIADYLVPHLSEITQEIVEILESNDCEWKFSILSVLVMRSTKLDDRLVEVLTRIARRPTIEEIQNEVNLISDEILSKRFNDK